MKLTFLFSIAFLIGCASKPDVSKMDPSAVAKYCVENDFSPGGAWGDNNAYCEGVKDSLAFLWVVKNHPEWIGPLEGSGSISHVTRSQWEAAQALYNQKVTPDSPCEYTAPNHFVVACPDHAGDYSKGVTFSDTRTGFTWYRACPTCTGLVLEGSDGFDTLPPSGDAK